MAPLNTSKVHVRNELSVADSVTPRRYTLTHSDRTGDLFLTIADDFDREQISEFYTRLMRDEALAEWMQTGESYTLHLYLHVSGGFVFGWARMRDKIFRSHLPLVLQVIRYGDRELFERFPKLDEAAIIVHFQSPRKKFNKTELYGSPGQFKVF